MGTNPLSEVEAYEHRLEQETSELLTNAIQKRKFELDRSIESVRASASAMERDTAARLDATRQGARSEFFSVKSQATIAPIVSLGFLFVICIATCYLTQDIVLPVMVILLSLVIGAIAYFKPVAAALVIVFFGSGFAFVFALATNDEVGSSAIVPNPTSTYFFLYLLILIIFAVTFGITRWGRNRIRSARQDAMSKVARVRDGAEKSRLGIQSTIDSSVSQYRDLDRVMTLWRAGGPDAERAAEILSAQGMTEEAGALRTYERRIGQIQIRYGEPAGPATGGVPQSEPTSHPPQADTAPDSAGMSHIPCPACRTLAKEGTAVCEICGFPLADTWKSLKK
jgi:hypothetical protein